MSGEPVRCPRCGAQLNAAGEVCAVCLFRAAAGDGASIGSDLTIGAVPEPTGRLSAPGTAALPVAIGPYRIVSLLGEGGMGVVYLAEQVEPIRRTVALKVIKLGLDTRGVVARFESERQALALMDHPNIARVIDAGATSDGRPYFVMEHVAGVPITDYCDAHRFSTRARLALLAQVCGAVQHAHQKGVIHRDLKPSNVLVGEQDGTPVPKVIDFGVAKATDRRLTERTIFTELGQFIGTPAYMSPEQTLGALDIDATTDIYALGVILYELLAGVLPFEPTALRRAGYAEMQRIIREDEPPKPSTKVGTLGETASDVAGRRQTDAGNLRRELSGDLDWITLKALEKDRTRRYASASEFAADITRYLLDELIVARPASASYRTRKFVRRHRVAVVTTGLVAASVVAALAISLVMTGRAQRASHEEARQRQDANARREEAERERGRAEAFALEADKSRSAAEVDAQDARAARAESELRRIESDQRRYETMIALIDSELRRPGAKYQLRDKFMSIPPEQRGWEWRHLFLALTSPQAYKGPLDPGPRLVNPVVPGTDGRVFVVTQDGIDTYVGETRKRLAHYATSERVLAIDDAGHALLLDAKDTQMTAVDISTGGRLGVVPASVGHMCAAIAPTGDRIAIGRPDGVFEVRGLADGRLIGAVQQRAAPGCSVIFSHDGTKVASGYLEVRIWSAETGRDILALMTPSGARAQPVIFGPDSRTAAVGREDGSVDVFDLANPASPPLRLESAVAEPILRVVFSADGTLLAGATEFATAIWNIAGYSRPRRHLIGFGRWRGFPNLLGSMAFSTDNQRLVDHGTGGDATVWSTYGASVSAIPDPRGPHGSPTADWALSRDGARLALAGMDGILVLRTTDMRPVAFAPSAFDLGPTVLTFSADGTRMAASGKDTVIRIWNVASGSEEGAWIGGDARISTMSASPNGRLLATGSVDGAVRLWDWSTGRVVATRKENSAIGTVVFQSNETLLIGWLRSQPGQGGLRRWHWPDNAATPAVMKGDSVTCIATSPDGRQVLATGSTSGAMWNASLTRQIGKLPDRFGCPGFSPDGKRIVANGRLFDAERLTELLLLDQLAPGSLVVGPMFFSADGERIFLVRMNSIHSWNTRGDVPGYPFFESPTLAAPIATAAVTAKVPNLTGEWVLDGASTRTGTDPAVGASGIGPFRIVLVPNMLFVTNLTTDKGPITTTFRLDGSRSANISSGLLGTPMQLRASWASWEGDRIRISDTEKGQSDSSWFYLDGGRLVIEHVSKEGLSQRTFYRRAQ